MLLEVHLTLRGNGADRAAVLLLHARVPQFFQKLLPRVDDARAPPIRPSAALGDGLHDFVAVPRLLLDGVEHEVADLVPLGPRGRASKHVPPVASPAGPYRPNGPPPEKKCSSLSPCLPGIAFSSVQPRRTWRRIFAMCLQDISLDSSPHAHHQVVVPLPSCARLAWRHLAS